MSEWKLGNSNKSSAYLLPLLNQNGKIFFNEFIDDNKYPQRNFVNIFYKCEEYPELRNRLFVLYKKDIDNPVYQNFETRLRFFEEFEFEYEPDNVNAAEPELLTIVADSNIDVAVAIAKLVAVSFTT